MISMVTFLCCTFLCDFHVAYWECIKVQFLLFLHFFFHLQSSSSRVLNKYKNECCSADIFFVLCFFVYKVCELMYVQCTSSYKRRGIFILFNFQCKRINLENKYIILLIESILRVKKWKGGSWKFTSFLVANCIYII
jgi:hypothetical protein